MPQPTPPSLDEQIPQWPTLHASLRADGHAELTVNGTATPISSPTVEGARAEILERATTIARDDLARPVRLHTEDPNGTSYQLAVHPDGTVTVLATDPAPRSRRAGTAAPATLPVPLVKASSAPTPPAVRPTGRGRSRRSPLLALLGVGALGLLALLLTALGGSADRPAAAPSPERPIAPSVRAPALTAQQAQAGPDATDATRASQRAAAQRKRAAQRATRRHAAQRATRARRQVSARRRARRRREAAARAPRAAPAAPRPPALAPATPRLPAPAPAPPPRTVAPAPRPAAPAPAAPSRPAPTARPPCDFPPC